MREARGTCSRIRSYLPVYFSRRISRYTYNFIVFPMRSSFVENQMYDSLYNNRIRIGKLAYYGVRDV